MRSKSKEVDSPANRVLVVPHAIHEINEEAKGEEKLLASEKNIKAKVQQKEDEEKLQEETDDNSTKKNDQRLGLKDLSKDDLLKLLGVMEGEIQVRSIILSNHTVNVQEEFISLVSYLSHRTPFKYIGHTLKCFTYILKHVFPVDVSFQTCFSKYSY